MRAPCILEAEAVSIVLVVHEGDILPVGLNNRYETVCEGLNNLLLSTTWGGKLGRYVETDHARRAADASCLG